MSVDVHASSHFHPAVGVYKGPGKVMPVVNALDSRRFLMMFVVM